MRDRKIVRVNAWRRLGLKATLTAEVATEHEVEDEETVFVILECIPKVDDERVVNLTSRNLFSRGGVGTTGTRPSREAAAPG